MGSDDSSGRHDDLGRTEVQRSALTVGAALLLVGLAGFVMGPTWNLGRLGWAGPGSGAMLLGLFQVSVLHNVVHLAYGALGLGAAAHRLAARRYLVWGGCAFSALAAYGMLTGDESAANLLPTNAADDWAHLALGVTLVVLGLRRATGRPEQEPARSSTGDDGRARTMG